SDLLKALTASMSQAPRVVPGPTPESASAGGLPELQPIILDAEIASILGVFPPILRLGESLGGPMPVWASLDLTLGWYLENRDLIDESRLVWVTAAQIRRAAEDARSQRKEE